MITTKTIIRAMGAMGTMKPIKPIKPILPIGIMVFFLLFPVGLFAQWSAITIGGNVYGGGNQGKVDGNTTVTVRAGDLNKVFGGARMADVGGRSFLNIDGENASSNIFIVEAYGGNDIAGTVGESGEETTVPAELTDVQKTEEDKTDPTKNAIDNSWKTFVRTTRSSKTVAGKQVDDHAVIIGALYGGGNGDFDYEQVEEDGKLKHYIYDRGNRDTYIAYKETPLGDVGFQQPIIPKTYLEIKGGCIAHAYGGGNYATVSENTTISIQNESDDLETQAKAYAATIGRTEEQVYAFLMGKVKLNTFQSDYSSWKFNFARVFGGNNKADMAIRPVWNLQTGMIRDLYSGGNEGRMTHEDGLLLIVNPEPTNPKPLVINNVYGGCRMADVRPKTKEWDAELDDYKDAEVVKPEPGYYFPANFAARTLIMGGDINNVYGGNDVKGKVYFGNAVGVQTSIRGDLYGGGNGAYAYTDNSELGKQAGYSDFFYERNSEQSSVQALLDVRPNAEQVTVMIRGTKAKPTIIGGSVYCGGNCATLKKDDIHKNLPGYPMTRLVLGSHVIADKVYLGNNGEGMVKEDLLKIYKDKVGGEDFNSMDLTQPDQMVTYMEGAAMDLVPTLVVENRERGDRYTYDSYTSQIGSLYLGGNVGSMTYPGKDVMEFDAPIIVYDKVVGGCNNANVAASTYNARYEGGILGSTGERYEGGILGATEKPFTDDEGNIKDRLDMSFSGLRIEPKRWKIKRDAGDYSPILTDGKPTYVDDKGHDLESIIGICTDESHGAGVYGHACLEWNTWKQVESYPAVEAGEALIAGKTYYTSAGGAGKFVADGTEALADGTNFFEWKRSLVETGSTDAADDLHRRLIGGDVYGGCYSSGHVNGNIAINLNDSLHNRRKIFAQFETEEDGEDILYEPPAGGYKIIEGKRNSGVILNEQGMDPLGDALNVYGGGYGQDTEIWGKATINLKRGYTFQLFGGGEKGAIGRGVWDGTKYTDYTNDEKYGTYVNLHGVRAGDTRSKDGESPLLMAESEFIYGGGLEGIVAGSTHVNLGNGRIFNSFAGCCDADVLGHTETYVGRGVNYDTGAPEPGFPWIRDHIYGGNDLGGSIMSQADFSSRVRDYENAEVKAMIHNPDAEPTPNVLKANAYVEYIQGRVSSIFGGCFGDYDYSDEYKNTRMPYLKNAFVNFRPTDDPIKYSSASDVLGAGEGFPGDRNGDAIQDRSYVLMDIPDGVKNFQTTNVFGSGRNNGVGMRYSYAATTDGAFDLDDASAIIDLKSGQIAATYGGSYDEGVTRRTVVNVPKGSTINVGKIFGGGYGSSYDKACDVYEAHVNYGSDLARTSTIYGGNNSERKTVYGFVNVSSTIWSDKEKGYLGTVYGAGYGKNTWSEYTEVNLEKGAQLYEVYGGGENGKVWNSESIQAYANIVSAYGVGVDSWKLGSTGYDPADFETGYVTNTPTNLQNPLTRTAEMDERDYTNPLNKVANKYKYNTNVIIHEGATVSNYAYGGGKGSEAVIAGTTYIALLGGKVIKDIYAAGTEGAVQDTVPAGNFLASANAYIMGGSVRNVYGGGWKGSVGKLKDPTNGIRESAANTKLDNLGETHVLIGRPTEDIITDSLALVAKGITKHSFYYGRPAVQRNAYGGGEGGAVYGTANLTILNGYVGYEFNPELADDPDTENIDDRYVEKIVDDTYKNNVTGEFIPNKRLREAGCLFGGGYIDNSSVDRTCVKIYGGHIRNSAFGGGEVAAIGRGTASVSFSGGKSTHTLTGLYKPGKTNIEMFGGHVHRNVFGGGRGYNNLSEVGKLNTDGFVFGQTEVHIHGGEIGTNAGIYKGDGNVFGGGDVGFVYSALEEEDNEGNPVYYRGVKTDVRYGGEYQGYYYKHQWDNGAMDEQNESLFLHENGDERIFTEDCKVLIEPHCKVIDSGDVPFTNIYYKQGEQVSSGDLQFLKESESSLLDKIDVTGKVTAASGITFSRSYAKGDYVPIAALNTLKNKNADGTTWGKLDPTGIIIHNAVFAGGNTQPSATTAAYANTTSIFGNATASINDVYNRDLITLGTGHTGGLYGDGNLTFVDGYRELNITNYGTDYYNIKTEIEIETYRALPEREGAYYELKYTCQKECTDKDRTKYKPAVMDGDVEIVKASTITADDLLSLFLVYDKESGTYSSLKDGGNSILEWNDSKSVWVPNPMYWKESGVLPVYAGRLMNSIQRADFCGVWGSRMVMQGAQDRVPEEVDYTNYTINRVREVSLNKVVSRAGDTFPKDMEHGNYFGIYNVVNYLGALTSDVNFGDETGEGAHDDVDTGDERKTDNPRDIYTPEYAGQTFFGWKRNWWRDPKRNNGKSHNKVALASGVYLELTTEESTGTGLYEKVWGPITGVVELDLINVAPGIGGGYVYAKNIHGKRTETGATNTTLTALNRGAVTQWDYTYDPDDADKHEWQTSGNFVHSSQTIIDDCYNIGGKYKTNYNKPDGVPAHYWFIKGSVYVYDQYISAYTGLSNSYSEMVEIPLTITAASHGKMRLLNVQPNYYAYYSALGVELENEQKMIINDKPYYKNDPISFWDWYLLSPSERALFVPQTYVNCVAVKIDSDDTLYEAGTYIMSQEEYDDFMKDELGVERVHTFKDAEGKTIQDADKNDATADYIFRSSNKMSHNTGYILTYDVTNPVTWDKWYTLKSSATQEKVNAETYANKGAEQSNYISGPTYRLNLAEGGLVLGQLEYNKGDIINKNIYDTYDAMKGSHLSDIEATGKTQATFDRAYVVTKQVSVQIDGSTHHQNPGSTVSKAEADTAPYADKAAPAFVCTSTVQLSKTDFVYMNEVMTEAEKNGYISQVNDEIEAIAGKVISEIDDLTSSEQDALSSEQLKTLKAWCARKKELTENIVPAYICTEEGSYGGNYYQSGQNYSSLEAWCSMSGQDREHFVFNYDALDLLVDSTYTDLSYDISGDRFQYDGEGFNTEIQAKTNPAGYSILQPVDYTATYYSDTPLSVGKSVTVTRKNAETGKYEQKSVTEIQKDDELSREAFESLTNEQRHYSVITVKDGEEQENGDYLVYVVSKSFQIGSTPFAAGSVISSDVYAGLPEMDDGEITELKFSSDDKDKTFFFCRESYKVGYNGKGVAVTNIYGSDNTTYTNTQQVPLGTIISKSNYEALEEQNQQKSFDIHGVSPAETSTLYVSRESDIYDLSKEKIITVIYQYDYDEVQTSGAVTPISERHVVNIHINFRSGVPIVEDIQQPEIILPGDYVGMKTPTVTPGAYELLGGGWELYEEEEEAANHTNGIDYNPIFDPLYWYQHNWYVSYYAKTYLGRTYSNSVPVSVANYHDLANVMNETTHHMYVDHPGVLRNSKIYINDYTSLSKNGLDELKRLFDLSLLTTDDVNVDGDGLITTVKATGEDSPFKGHALLDSHVRAERNLDFFLRTDIEHTEPWTPIGYNGICDDPSTPEEDEALSGLTRGECFDGTFNGDGHTISGLDHSLFNHLCGDVYNLGVTGTFTGSGIAETGRGYVESCWTSTSSEEAKTSKPVFGTPNRNNPAKPYQIVNCYYQEEDGQANAYTNHNADSEYGTTVRKPKQAFYNGEVAYDLNSFYLNKRYYHGTEQSTGTEYLYLPANKGDGTLPEDAVKGYYPTADNGQYGDLGYVERRFSNDDFRYAAGTIPEEPDIRFRTDTETEESYYAPIWPDDYLFFGQKLTYGYMDGEGGRALIPHQEWPSAINRSDGRVDLGETGNRVYRAPAYFRNSIMSVAHFNPTAFLAQTEKDKPSVLAYPNMTAIDFADHKYGGYETYKAYKQGEWDASADGLPKMFYPPLLDDDGLDEIENCDETRNLLVYAPDVTANEKTNNVLSSYFYDPYYYRYYNTGDTPEGYRLVDDAITETGKIFGHLVESDLTAHDHLLLDGQDFDCPISYTFQEEALMWYQRIPTDNEYVDHSLGWQGISLPFTAELVTTNEKGEITHFYSGSNVSKNGTGAKIGHEYWLREFNAIKEEGSPAVALATFDYPLAEGKDKENGNTFLWDYYYNGPSTHSQKDENRDDYQDSYYSSPRVHPSYPLLTAGKPYLLGLPGEMYYEFDLSGKFEAQNTNSPVKLSKGKQIITFASNPGATIAVSDTEKAGVKQTYNGTDYIFKPNYLKDELTTTDYVLNDVGDQYEQVTTSATLSPFRPYFRAVSSSGVKGFRSNARSIRFSREISQMHEEEEDDINSTGQLIIRAERGKILVTSTLAEERKVRIANVGGATIDRYTIQPGQTRETSVSATGVYIVNKKKISVGIDDGRK